MTTQIDPKGAIKKMGGKPQIRRELRQIEADNRLLERKWESLLAEHLGEWVAVYQGEFLFAPSLDELIKRARERDLPLGNLVVDQLLEERSAVLL